MKTHGSKQGEAEFKELLDSVNKKTEAAEIADYLKKLRKEAAAAAKKQRRRKFFQSREPKRLRERRIQELTALSALVRDKAVFKTIFINPPPDVPEIGAPLPGSLSKSWPSAIRSLIYERRRRAKRCRASSTAPQVIFRPDLKLLTAAGFAFRDVFSPSSGVKGFELLRSEKLLLRGERGAPTHPTLNAEVEANDAGALSIAQELGGSPRLYVFAPEAIDGWTCAAPDQH